MLIGLILVISKDRTKPMKFQGARFG